MKTPGLAACRHRRLPGRGQENVAYEIIDYARKVARGEIDDPGTLPILFEIIPDDDWRDEDVWRRVNPGLEQGFPDIEGLRQLAREAEDRPADREAFRQLHLNVWLDHSIDPFVDMDVYDEGAEPLDLDALAGEPCYLGVDLSSNSDLTVVAALWRVGDGYAVLPHFFCPADNLRGRQDRDAVPYVRWAEEGFIEPTPGNVVDFRAVEDCIRDLCARFNVRAIGLDPHLARSTINNLTEDGLPGGRSAAGLGDDGAGHQRAGARHHRPAIPARRPSGSAMVFRQYPSRDRSRRQSTLQQGQGARPDRRRRRLRDRRVCCVE